MKHNQLTQLKSQLDDLVKHTEDGIEFWYARELQKLLGYKTWENFHAVIQKAVTSCENSQFTTSDFFREVTKEIKFGKGGVSCISDYQLTRYACYLIAQNGDPRKEEIAFVQSYFAVQTRKQEIIEQRMQYLQRSEAREKLKASEKRLSENIYERGVNEQGFARIRSKGDSALFGGNSTREMKQRLGVNDKRPIADFLPTVTIAAKNLATEISNHNIEHHDIYGEEPITTEHVQNNLSVREVLAKRGIVPEDLPPSEDIKKLERRIKTEHKRLEKKSGKFKK